MYILYHRRTIFTTIKIKVKTYNLSRFDIYADILRGIDETKPSQ